MPIDSKFVGRQYGPHRYEVGLEKMKEFAFAVAGGMPSHGFGEPPTKLHPLYWDEEAGKRSRYGSIIAFPTFAVTFAIKPFAQALSDPELNINLLRLVHGEQDFEFIEVIRPNDVLTTTGTLTELYERAGKDFVVMTTESKNASGRLVVRGTWTAVIRH